MYRADLFPLRGSVNPLLEAEDMPLDFLPWQVLPGHLQGQALCFGAWPLTHGFTFSIPAGRQPIPGVTPGLCFSGILAPAASAWRLLVKGPLHRGLLEVTPFPVSMGHILRAVLSTGFVGSADRSVSRDAGALSCAFWLQRVSLLRWFAFTVAQPHLCLRCP